MYMTQVMPPLRVMNLNYSLSVKHMLEGLLQPQCVTEKQIDNLVC